MFTNVHTAYHAHLTHTHGYIIVCHVNTRIEVIRANLLCECCCTVAVRTGGIHTMHSHIHHDYKCIEVVHTRLGVVSVVLHSSSKQSKKKQKSGMMGSNIHRTYTDRYNNTAVTAYAGGYMGHGLLHATHASCWCCCCGATDWIPIVIRKKKLQLGQPVLHR